MKTIITSFLILATAIVAQARSIQHWTDLELLEKSDLVVIATPTTSADTQERTGLPGLASQQVIGVETGFAVSAVVKGDRTLKNFVLHHYRADEGIVPNGPCLVAFKPEEKRAFLLYIKREADGRYAPTVGQVDPAMQGIIALCLGSIAIADTSVAVLNPPSRVKGRLGKPLGSRIVIEGVFAERMMMGNPLLVSAVDGEAVKQPVAVEIHDKVQIEKGKQYRLEGYESGAFGGPPDWTVGEGIPQQPFQFYSFFVVTKVLEPKSK